MSTTTTPININEDNITKAKTISNVNNIEIKSDIKSDNITKEKQVSSFNKEEDVKVKDNKNEFMNKIKMFQQRAEGSGEIQTKNDEKIKKVSIVEKKVESEKKEENDKAKEQRMSKALQRIKKKKDKDKDKETEESNSGKNDRNDSKFKSMKIKNMAEQLEGQMNKSLHSGEINNNNISVEGETEIKREESDLIEMIQNQPGKVVYKGKMTKKKFEEE